MTTGRASMQGVGAVVDCQAVFFSVHGEFALANTVAVAANQGRKERFGGFHYALNAVVALNDIGHIALAVGNHDADKRTTIVGNTYLHAIIVDQCEQIRLFALYDGLEILSLQAGNELFLHRYLEIKFVI